MADILAINHHRWQRHISTFSERKSIQALDKSWLHMLAKSLDHLHHKFLSARYSVAPLARLAAGFEPGRASVAAATRICAHIGRPAKAGDASKRGGRAIARQINLQG